MAVLDAAARLQRLVPDAVLVGGSAAAYHAGHHDHVVDDLTSRFDDVLAALEDSQGWVTARVKRPVLISDPAGPLAERSAALVDAYPMYGTSPLWRAWLDRRRIRAEPRATATLSELRRHVGMTQAAVATRLGISQSDVSKLERRSDLKLSTLRDYLAALGLPLRLITGAETGSQLDQLGLVVADMPSRATTSPS